jgi:hypothetical protein
MACSLVKVNLRFVGMSRLHHHGVTVSQARNQYEVGNKTNYAGPHGVMSRKIELTS